MFSLEKSFPLISEGSLYMLVRELVPKVLSKIQIQSTEPVIPTGFKTGFSDLDRLIGGFQPGELIIVASRPSAGKTAFIQSIMVNQLEYIESCPSILLISLDTTIEHYIWRLLFTLSKINSSKIWNEGLDSVDLEVLRKSADMLNKSSIHIINQHRINIEKIRQLVSEIKNKADLDLIVIDSLQMLGFGKGSDSDRNELDDVVFSLKNLAEIMGIPIVALTSLSRRLERRQNKEPMLTDLKGSSRIEDVADKILLLHRPEIYDADESTPGDTVVTMAKNKNGPTGMARLRFIGKYTRFFNFEIKKFPHDPNNNMARKHIFLCKKF